MFGPLDRRQFTLAATAGALTTRWRSLTDTAAPPYLNGHSGAYDRRRQASLIFGGADEAQVLSTLWQFRAGQLCLLSRFGPLQRTFAAAAYDSRRDRLVVFGGNRVLFGTGGDTILSDHWEWDGRRWSRFEGTRPPGRTEAGCAFDENRGRIVLFGGWRFERGERVRLGDLWEFDGHDWTQQPGGPEPRSGAAMTYDPVARRIIVAGGNGPRKDVWALERSRWSRLPDLPQARFNPAMAFDRARDQALLFGGWTGRERIAATAVFSDGRWSTPPGPEPAARNHSLLVPTGDGSRLLLIGGHTGDDLLGDQWEWAGRWRPLLLPAPRPRVANNH